MRFTDFKELETMGYKINELVADKFSEYKAYDAINASFLKSLKTSPLTALNKHYSETDALRFGSIYHKYVLENHDFNNEYQVFDENKRPNQTMTMAAKENKEWKNKLCNEAKTKGIEFIKPDELNQVEAMRNQLFENTPYAKTLIDGCITEVSLYTTLLIDGREIPVKCRFDGIDVEKGIIADLKTALDASPYGFSRDAGKYNYHIQAAWYMFLARMVFKKDFKMLFIAQEKTQPYNSAIYNVSNEMRIKGENELLTLIEVAAKLQQIEKAGSYEVFSNNKQGIFDLDIPSYYSGPLNFNL